MLNNHPNNHDNLLYTEKKLGMYNSNMKFLESEKNLEKY